MCHAGIAHWKHCENGEKLNNFSAQSCLSGAHAALAVHFTREPRALALQFALTEFKNGAQHTSLSHRECIEYRQRCNVHLFVRFAVHVQYTMSANSSVHGEPIVYIVSLINSAQRSAVYTVSA